MLIAEMTIHLDRPLGSGEVSEIYRIVSMFEYDTPTGKVSVYGDVGGYEVEIELHNGTYDGVSDVVSALDRAGYDQIEKYLY